ncbi:MAG: hypothetical protein PHC43_00820 [Candidatus Marinimicrobia bacterium]|jgi:hypothetical protein|nr:hypothetical protein [Candidatus Neomarinimicrobiota bacterium]MDD5539504.1 hypothetical protein [Candidatus Neomarinimicrobiota bacterium]
MWEKLISLLIEKGILPADKKDAVNDALKDFKIEQPGVPPGPIMVDTAKLPPELKQTVDTLVSMVNNLTVQNKDLLTTLANEKRSRDEAIKAQTAAAESQRKAKVADLITVAFGNEKDKKPGKLPVAKKDWFQNFADKDYDAAKTFLDEYPGDPNLEKGGKGGDDDKGGGGGKPANPFTSSMGGNPALAKAIGEQTQISEKE